MRHPSDKQGKLHCGRLVRSGQSGADDGDPWAVDAVDVASKRLEVALGSYVGEGQEPGGEFSPAQGEVPLADAPLV